MKSSLVAARDKFVPSPDQLDLRHLPRHWKAVSAAGRCSAPDPFRRHTPPDGAGIPLPRGTGSLSNGTWTLPHRSGLDSPTEILTRGPDEKTLLGLPAPLLRQLLGLDA